MIATIRRSFPSLESCWSQGKTREAALDNIREAITLYLEPEPVEIAPKRSRKF